MSKEIDLGCEQAEFFLEQRIKAVTGRYIGVSAFECIDCGNPIPEQRRMAVPGCLRCIDCQDIFELKQKHYQGV